MVATAEVMYAKSTNEIDYKNLNIEQTGETLPFDGRPIYETVSGDYSGAYYLTNTDKGDALNVILKLELPYGEQPIWGIASYTYGESNVVNDATSSRAVSNWQYNEALGPEQRRSLDLRLPDRAPDDDQPQLRVQPRIQVVDDGVGVLEPPERQTVHEYLQLGLPLDQRGPITGPTTRSTCPRGRTTWSSPTAPGSSSRTTSRGPGSPATRARSHRATRTTTPWITQTDLAIRQNIPIPGSSSLQVSPRHLQLLEPHRQRLGHRVSTSRSAPWSRSPTRASPTTASRSTSCADIVTDPEDNPLYEYDNIRSRWRLRLGVRWSF